MFIVYIDNRTLAGTCVPVYTFPFIHYINLDIKTSTHNVVHRQDPFLDRISRTIFYYGGVRGTRTRTMNYTYNTLYSII